MDKQIDNKLNSKTLSAYQLAMNLGFMIVTPMVLFGIGGVMLDRHFGTYPIFILIGFFIAMVSGLTIVYVKTKDIIIQGLPKKNNK